MATPETTTPQPPRHPPSLHLPPSQFARLQPHAYLLAHLSPPASSNNPPVRANGRDPAQFRVTSANTGSLTHTNGSAVVRTGDTVAVCGVRAEVLHTADIASWSVSTANAAEREKNRSTRNRWTDSATGGGLDGDGYDDNNGNDNDEDEDEAHIQDLNLLVPNLSLSTGCAPGFSPGAPPSTLAQALSHQLLSLLHSSRLVRAEDLRIRYRHPDFSMGEAHNESERLDVDEDEHRMIDDYATEQEIKAFWVLYIDVMIISLAGNPFDAAWAAVLAALRDTTLPRAWWDADNEMVVCSDAVSEARKLSLRGLPVASSFCVFDADAAAGWRAVVIPDAAEEEQMQRLKKGLGSQSRWILADPDGYEESLCQERVCLVVDKERGGEGRTVIIKMEKNGGWAVGREELRRLVNLAALRWNQIKHVLEG